MTTNSAVWAAVTRDSRKGHIEALLRLQQSLRELGEQRVHMPLDIGIAYHLEESLSNVDAKAREALSASDCGDRHARVGASFIAPEKIVGTTRAFRRKKSA